MYFLIDIDMCEISTHTTDLFFSLDDADDKEEVINDPYVCVECGAEFSTNVELDSHKRRSHPPVQRYDNESTSEEEDDFPFRYR